MVSRPEGARETHVLGFERTGNRTNRLWRMEEGCVLPPSTQKCPALLCLLTLDLWTPLSTPSSFHPDGLHLLSSAAKFRYLLLWHQQGTVFSCTAQFSDFASIIMHSFRLMERKHPKYTCKCLVYVFASASFNYNTYSMQHLHQTLQIYSYQYSQGFYRRVCSYYICLIYIKFYSYKYFCLLTVFWFMAW